jgi:N-acetylglutamate synthase-like GNAT family acetyltransferase
VCEAKGISLRPVAAADEKFLRQLYASTRQDMAFLPLPPDAKEQLLRMQFEAQRVHYSSLYPNADHSIVLAGDSLAGRLYLDRQQSQILIVDIALLPEFQRRSIGRALFLDLQMEATRLEKAIAGHVARTNHASRSFFEAMGFQIADEDELYFKISWI